MEQQQLQLEQQSESFLEFEQIIINMRNRKQGQSDDQSEFAKTLDYQNILQVCESIHVNFMQTLENNQELKDEIIKMKIEEEDAAVQKD